jgi:hypothetical protein
MIKKGIVNSISYLDVTVESAEGWNKLT